MLLHNKRTDISSLQKWRVLVIVLALLLLASCSGGEITAKPLRQTAAVEHALAEKLADATQKQDAIPAKAVSAPTAAVSLDEPREKIHPRVREKLKVTRAKKEHIRVLIDTQDASALQEIANAVEQAGGSIEQSFTLGNIAVADIPADAVEELALQEGILEIAAEREYVALVDDRISAFSIDTAAWQNNTTGKGARIAILDTGIGPHGSVPVALANTFVNGEDSADRNGHGTHVAGIAHAVSPGAQIINAKVLNRLGAGTTSQIIAGISWAVDPDGNPATDDGADIISMSFGGMFTDLDGPLASAVRDAMRRGVIFIAAAGNCRQGCGGFFGVTTPANVKEVIAVGALDDNNLLAQFSSGDTFAGYVKPDITAPGVSITSAWLDNGEKTLSGTSMSAPFAAGIVALLLEQEGTLAQEQAKQRLTSTATDAGATGWDAEYGAGIVNVPALMGLPAQPPASLPVPELPGAENLNRTTVFTDFTIISEDEKSGKYAYASDNGESLILSYNITSRTTEQEVSAQMVLAYYHAPSTRADVTVELFAQIPANKNPRYLNLMIESYGTTTYFDSKIVPLPAAVINALIAGDYVTMDTFFTTPSAYGKYNAFVVVLNDQQTAIIPYVRDAVYPNGKVFEVVNLVGPGQCDRDSDCPADRYVSTPYCSGGDVWQRYQDNYCRDAGTPNSLCAYDLYDKKKQDCGTATCSSGACSTSGPCTLGSLTPSHFPTIVEGQTFSAAIEGWEDTCNGQSVTFEIWEEDDLSGDDFVTGFSNPFVGRQVTGSWVAQWASDEFGGPEYYYNVIGPQNTMKSVTVAVERVCNNNGVCEPARGENNPNCPNDCKKANGDPCAGDTECQSGYCHNNACNTRCVDSDRDGYGTDGVGCTISDTLRDCNDGNAGIKPGAAEVCDAVDNDCDGQVNENNVCCGNSFCDNGETPGTCGTDCFGDLDIVQILSAPSTVDQGQTVQITATVRNKGTYTDTLKIEAGIVPDYWQGTIFSEDFGAQSYSSVAKCCPGNDYYDAKQITLAGGESENVVFTVKAPGVSSQDSCWSNNLFRSAWDTSHTVFVGLYPACKAGYKDKDSRDIKVRDKPCLQPGDCGANEYCKFTGTTGACWPKICTDKCAQNAYGCNGQTIRQCKDANNDGCAEWVDTSTTCPAGFACVSGQNACEDVSIQTRLFVENTQNARVTRQPGDTLKVLLDADGSETITLEYDSARLRPESCPTGTFTISQDTHCTFEVTGSSGEGFVALKHATKTKIDILSRPKGIILTSAQKLKERFPGKDAEVASLLTTAHQYADANDFVLYDIEGLVDALHPFQAWTNYNEQQYNPSLRDNAYALEVARFVREKCKDGCSSTLILGDDYVVPHYRRDIQFLNNYFFFTSTNTDTIYSDIPYVNRKEKMFSQLRDLFYFEGEYSGKKLKVITPAGMSNAMSAEVTAFENALRTQFSPRIERVSASEIYCNDRTIFPRFDSATLLVIGTEESNQAFNCMPFVSDLENRDSAFIEVNPWDGTNYAIVVNTDNPAALQAVTAMIETGKFEKATSRVLWFVEVGLDIASYLSVVCEFGTGLPCDTPVDAASTGFVCAVKRDAILCSVSTAMLGVPYVPAAPVKAAVKAFVKNSGVFIGRVIAHAGDDFIHYLSRAFRSGDLDETIEGLEGLARCAFSAQSYVAQSHCPEADDWGKFLRKRPRNIEDKERLLARSDPSARPRIGKASQLNIDDAKFARMLDSEIPFTGSALNNFQIPDSSKPRVATLLDGKGNRYFFKRDAMGGILLEQSNVRERIMYRLNYLLDETDTAVKLPRTRLVKDVTNNQGVIETGLLTEDLGGPTARSFYERDISNWGDTDAGQVRFFRFSRDITDKQRETMQKQMARDFVFGSGDRNLANSIVLPDGRIGFIDYEHSLATSGDLLSPIYDVPATVNGMFDFAHGSNILRDAPQFRALQEDWNLYPVGSIERLREQKRILDLLEPEVQKLEKLSADQFEALLQLDDLRGGDALMHEAKQKIFGGTGQNSRLKQFIANFKLTKKQIEDQLQ